MDAFFFDSSALVKRYLSEQGSAWVQGVVDPAAGNEAFVVRITHVEVASALARRRKNGLIDSGTAAALMARVASDFLGGLAVIEVTEPLIGDAVQFVESHDLRAYDGIQLSACHQLNLQRQALGLIPATFVCSDMALIAVAAANGLAIENPNDHPKPMISWSIHVGDLLDVPAEVLVLSANFYLNFSGGVGGAFALRYGPAMQQALHYWLAERNLRHVPQGTVVSMLPLGSPYSAVLHAVGVDALYATSPPVVAEVIDRSLHAAAASGARTVALAAIGTGYGRLSMSQFAAALEVVATQDYPPLENVVIGLRKEDEARELAACFRSFHSGSGS